MKTGAILTVLSLAFIVLRLCNVVTWSWWAVTSPFWGGASLALIGFVLWQAFLAAVRLLEWHETRHVR